MKANFTRIAVILDRSGSMQVVRDATIEGFNEFVKGQKAEPGDATLKLVQFNTDYEEVFDKPIQKAHKLSRESFQPIGGTALLDAQGRTIDELGKELAALPEHERPSKVIVVTITDGEENSSLNYTRAQVAEMIEHQREVYGWDFVFLGANQDAVKVAATMNIPVYSAMSYSASNLGTQNMMAAVSNYVGVSRSMKSAAFTDEERGQAMAQDDGANDITNAKNNVDSVLTSTGN